MELRNGNGLTEKEFLEQYKPGDYQRPSVTVDMLLMTIDNSEVKTNKQMPEKELKILLIKRKDHPFMGQWAVPGGFVDINEDMDSAVYRELKEETNVENVFMEQLCTWGKANRDPRMRVVSTSYLALVAKDGLNPVAGDDAEEVKWFSVRKEMVSSNNEETVWNLLLTSDDGEVICYLVIDSYKKNGVIKTTETRLDHMVYVSETELAFDHSEIINLAVDRLRGKLAYTDIAFNLLPKHFTLTELQKVYETILGKKLVTSNFRRDIKHKVIETKLVSSQSPTGKKSAYRPAKLFKYNNKRQC